MLQSMTGFAAGQGAKGDFSWSWEIRGVNAKGLDLRIRVPEWVEGLEAELRKQVTGALRRGNVTVNLRLSREETTTRQRLNSQQLDMVLTALAEIEQQAITRHVSLAPSTAAEIIALRGMMEHDEAATDTLALKSDLLKDFQGVLASFCEMRSAEGAALHQVLLAHIDEIEALVSKAKSAAEARRPKARETLRLALAAVMEGAGEVEEDRILQELALLAVKSDITEEINRLQAHVKAARELLDSPASVGRKLDFLMQEFNREANTLCSKSGDSALTAVGLDLKAVIDQMREQVQNVE